jgi:WD40 repeat protein
MGPTLWRRVLALLLVAVTAVPMALFGDQPTVIGTHDRVFCATRVRPGVFATGGFDGTVKLWMILQQKDEPSTTLDAPELASDAVLCVAADPDNRYLVAGTKKGRVAVFEWRRDIVKESAGTKLVAVDAEGKAVAFATDKEVRYRLEATDKGFKLSPIQEKASALAWMGDRLLVGGADFVREYTFAKDGTSAEGRKVTGLPGESVKALVGESKDTDLHALIVDNNGVIRRCRFPSRDTEAKKGTSLRVAVSGGESFVSVGKDNKFAIWSGGVPRKNNSVEGKDVIALAASPNGHVAFLTKGSKAAVRLWDGKNQTTQPLGDEIELDDKSEPCLAVHSSSNTTQVAVAFTSKGVSYLILHKTIGGILQPPRNLRLPLVGTMTDNKAAVALLVGCCPLVHPALGYLLSRAPKVYHLAFAPDGKSLLAVTQASKTTICEVDIASNECSHFDPAPDTITALAVGENGTVAGLAGKQLVMWKAGVTEPPPASLNCTHVALTEDGSHLGVVENKRTIRVWRLDPDSPRNSIELQQFTPPNQEEITQFGLVKQGANVTVVYRCVETLYANDLDVTWAWWTGEASRHVIVDSKASTVLRVGIDGKSAARGSLEAGKAVVNLHPQTDVTTCTLLTALFLPGGTILALNEGAVGKLQFFKTNPDKQAPPVIEFPSKNIQTVTTTPDENSVLVGFVDGTHLLLRPDHLSGGQALPKSIDWGFIDKPFDKNAKHHFSYRLKDGVILSGSEKELRHWEFKPSKRVVSDPVKGEAVCAVTWVPKTESFLVGRSNGKISKWTIGAKNPLGELDQLKSPVRAIAFFPAETSPSYIVAAEANKKLHRRDASDKNGKFTESESKAHNGQIFSAAVSPNAVGHRLIATASSDRTVLVHSIEDGKFVQKKRLTNYKDAVAAVAFHPAGEYLATLDFGGRIQSVSLLPLDGKDMDVSKVKDKEQKEAVKPTAYSLIWADDNHLVIPAGDKLYRLRWNNAPVPKVTPP